MQLFSKYPLILPDMQNKQMELGVYKKVGEGLFTRACGDRQGAMALS